MPVRFSKRIASYFNPYPEGQPKHLNQTSDQADMLINAIKKQGDRKSNYSSDAKKYMKGFKSTGWGK